MAYSTCAKCNSTNFEVVEASPRHSNYKMMFVQCSACGAVIGTMPYYDAGILAKENQTALADVKRQLQQIENSVAQVQRSLRH